MSQLLQRCVDIKCTLLHVVCPNTVCFELLHVDKDVIKLQKCINILCFNFLRCPTCGISLHAVLDPHTYKFHTPSHNS